MKQRLTFERTQETPQIRPRREEAGHEEGLIKAPLLFWMGKKSVERKRVSSQVELRCFCLASHELMIKASQLIDLIMGCTDS